MEGLAYTFPLATSLQFLKKEDWITEMKWKQGIPEGCREKCADRTDQRVLWAATAGVQPPPKIWPCPPRRTCAFTLILLSAGVCVHPRSGLTDPLSAWVQTHLPLDPVSKSQLPEEKLTSEITEKFFCPFSLFFLVFFFTFSYFPLSFSPFNFFHLIFALCVISFFHFALLTFCFSSHFLLPLPNSTNTFILPNRIFFTTSLALLSYRSV